MIQRFIELGEGYSDLYELLEIAKRNPHRLQKMMSLHTTKNQKPVLSLVVVLKPTEEGDFQPLYICREGIPFDANKKSKRFALFEQVAEELNTKLISIDVRSSDSFSEKELYYQYLIGILRMNHFISPLQ